jgi:hypothetical protein
VFVEYDDPKGVYSGGQPVRRRLRDTPLVVAALKDMAAHGGTLIAHGYTHAYDGGPNPYGVSGEDFELFRPVLSSTAGYPVLLLRRKRDWIAQRRCAAGPSGSRPGGRGRRRVR